MNFFRVNQLAKNFADNKIFSAIDFNLQQGEFITLLGPSGCGKSTLLRCLAGLIPADQGTIYVGEKNITHTVPQKREIGMVFQSYALFPNMSVTQNIAFGLKLQGLDASQIKTRVGQVIEMVALQGKEHYRPQQLSGGQRQRVALARALVVKPRILLLDEPLSALDAKIRRRLRQQLRDIQKELRLTTIFVTHDQEEAMVLSDRIFLMYQGTIIQQDTPEKIYTQPVNEFVAGFMGNYNIIDARQAGNWFAGSRSGKLAIRPESIYIREAGHHYSMPVSRPQPGIIKSHQLLGNVVRYQVSLTGGDLWVDRLNRSSESLLSPGHSVELLFNLNEIQPL